MKLCMCLSSLSMFSVKHKLREKGAYVLPTLNRERQTQKDVWVVRGF